MSETWPNISIKIDQMPNAETAQNETGKFEKYFSRNPGQGT